MLSCMLVQKENKRCTSQLCCRKRALVSCLEYRTTIIQRGCFFLECDAALWLVNCVKLQVNAALNKNSCKNPNSHKDNFTIYAGNDKYCTLLLLSLLLVSVFPYGDVRGVSAPWTANSYFKKKTTDDQTNIY